MAKLESLILKGLKIRCSSLIFPTAGTCERERERESNDKFKITECFFASNVIKNTQKTSIKDHITGRTVKISISN